MSIGAKAASVVFDQVSKAFDTVVAVDRVSFTIEPGSLVTLLGPSGCGKTTTLRLIAGLEMPTAGRIHIDERDVTTQPATARDVCMVFQSYALFPHMTVQENVAYGLRVGGKPKAEVKAKAQEGLELVGLADLGARMPSELSGGQQQRVAVARALVLEPQVLLFDEPLSNLDAKLRRRMREEIRELQRSLGLTTVYVTHDQEEALAVSDRIIVMNRAAIAQQGAPAELYERPDDRFVADFIGDANLVPAEILGLDGEMAEVRIGALHRRLRHRGLAPGAATVAIRPEAVRLLSPPQPDSLSGTVTKATYLGSRYEYTVATELGELFVTANQVEETIRSGESVAVRLADRGVTLIRD